MARNEGLDQTSEIDINFWKLFEYSDVYEVFLISDTLHLKWVK